MHEVHPPHEAIHSWKSFLIHIATIVIGLLIAVALEQTVEFFHHRSQKAELQEQMRSVLEADVKLLVADADRLQNFHNYVHELLTGVDAYRRGKPAPAALDPHDPRARMTNPTPSLAPYEAAKENGTVALLPAAQIRIYNRLSFQRERLLLASEQFAVAGAAALSFIARWDHSPVIFGKDSHGLWVDLSTLSSDELAEYQAVLGTFVVATDQYYSRCRAFAAQASAILSGSTDEAELLDAARESRTANP